MELQIEVKSRLLIKPASPTPPHLRCLHLSFLDQINPPGFVPFLYFYPPPQSHEIPPLILHHSHKLRDSLSHTLAKFIPLAGRRRHPLAVDCSDDGAPFFEAHVNCSLTHFFNQPNYPSLLNKLLPYLDWENPGNLTFAVQLNFFSCGSMALATCFSHQVVDGVSIQAFMNLWAATARGQGHTIPIQGIDNHLAKQFPPITGLPDYSARRKDKIEVRRFLVTEPALSALRTKFTIGASRASRVEALTAFIFRRYVETTHGEGRRYHICHMVNLRRRMQPPLPESYMGNLVGTSVVGWGGEDECGLVGKVREGIRRTDVESVKRLRQGMMMQSGASDKSVKGDPAMGVIPFSFASNLGLPSYGVDFGWGRPVWVTLPELELENLVTFLPTRSGEGAEVLIRLKGDDMAKLESDQEFLAFVSPFPSPIIQIPSSL